MPEKRRIAVASSKMTDAEIIATMTDVEKAVSSLRDPADRASVCFEVGLRNMCKALENAGKDVTDKALFAVAQAVVAGFILAQERAKH